MFSAVDSKRIRHALNTRSTLIPRASEQQCVLFTVFRCWELERYQKAKEARAFYMAPALITEVLGRCSALSGTRLIPAPPSYQRCSDQTVVSVPTCSVLENGAVNGKRYQARAFYMASHPPTEGSEAVVSVPQFQIWESVERYPVRAFYMAPTLIHKVAGDGNSANRQRAFYMLPPHTEEGASERCVAFNMFRVREMVAYAIRGYRAFYNGSPTHTEVPDQSVFCSNMFRVLEMVDALSGTRFYSSHPHTEGALSSTCVVPHVQFNSRFLALLRTLESMPGSGTMTTGIVGASANDLSLTRVLGMPWRTPLGHMPGSGYQTDEFGAKELPQQAQGPGTAREPLGAPCVH
eukprot:gene9640-7553_t